MSKKITTEQYKKEIDILTNNLYTVIGEYKNSKTKILMRHNVCNNTYEVKPNDFQQGYRCPFCYGSKRKTTDEFKEEVKKLVGDDFIVLGNYINNDTKIQIKHIKCGNIFETTPHTFLRCHSCKFCVGLNKKTTDEFKEEVKTLVGDEYIVLGNYETTHSKIKMKHKYCGFEYFVTPNKFLYGRRCPHCKQSLGEQKIEKYLKEKNINFTSEKRFEDCKSKRYLPFDFYLPNLNILIEYDGEQHYKPIFGEKRFEETKINDSIKNKYCLNKKILLIRIPYWEFNKINEILNEKLN